MSLVILFGPQAVGKMTVGQALEAQTGLALFHNHATIDLVTPFFSYGSKEGRALVASLRREMFQAIARSDHPGMIFTYVWAVDAPEDRTHIEALAAPFAAVGRAVIWVELEATFETRLARNRSANRLAHKPSKRDIDASEAELRQSAQTWRLNSEPGELGLEPYLRLDITDMSPDEAARTIKTRFNL